MGSVKKPLTANEDLFKGLKVSMGLHAAIIIAFTVKTLVFADPEKIDYSAAIRVDMVALPDKVAQDQLPPKIEEPPPPQAKPEPPPPKPTHKEVVVEKPVKTQPKKDLEAINLDKDKKKQKEALEKLKAMSAIEEMKKEAEKETKKMAGVGKPAPPTQIKGNVLSPGTALSGLNRLQHDNYLSTIDQQIKQNWNLPPYLANRPFRAQVRLKIDDKGHILSRDIILSSGNSSYDDYVLKAITDSEPFQPPPEKFVSIVAVNGLVIGFPE